MKNLKTLYYTSTIQAPPQKVHQIMLAPESYRDWTSFFSLDSDFRGDWSEGSKGYFTAKDETGHEVGLIASIDKNIPGELVTIRHIGILGKDGELYEGEQVDGWKNAYEIYRFREIEGGNTYLLCSVEVDSEEHEKMFEDIWPKSLARLKELCEK